MARAFPRYRDADSKIAAAPSPATPLERKNPREHYCQNENNRVNKYEKDYARKRSGGIVGVSVTDGDITPRPYNNASSRTVPSAHNSRGGRSAHVVPPGGTRAGSAFGERGAGHRSRSRGGQRHLDTQRTRTQNRQKVRRTSS
ncbi:hypothetical protein GWI33_000219 [Rhynchophorus ferrugineus]|uniref:Uncharacterized protein n=1 Tax=Rhynchophorus ferrugineus TaxID=354439 RepID=A0A834IX75_RHYFE|nr:hypothetical protein GWI33_000219 [Rhynchophorus ferrugineus]